ncbi:MAG: hypothetical protein MK081_05330 [Flavobacteriales bacterium]|nr:hypothetical protein [Flavobacteriales bacterium]
MKALLSGVALVFCCLSCTAQYEFNAIGGGLSYMKSLSEKRSGFGYQAGFGGEIKENWFLSLGYGNYSSIESVDPRVPANYNVEKYRLGVLYLIPKGKVKPRSSE